MTSQRIADLIAAKRNDHYLDSRRMLRKLGDESHIYQRAEARWCVLQDTLEEIEANGGPAVPPLPSRDAS